MPTRTRFKKLLKYLTGAGAILLVYLATAGVWASLSVGDLLPEEAKSNEQPLLTKHQTDILLRIEDPTFFHHAGLDVSRGQGLTTITSSLARDVFLSGKELTGPRGSFQSFYIAVFACCKKIDLGRDVMALVLNRHLSKEQQLRLFVTTVYMGRHDRKAVTGFEAAASVYLDKNLSDLSTEEFVNLVAMIKSPNFYHPVNGAKQLELRASRIASILAETCKPSGWFDTEYAHCKSE
jgi:membrane carboxypeptidase/penicillin-binding protein